MNIELTQNKVAIVDDEDYTWLSNIKWHAHKKTGTTQNDVYVARVKNKYDSYFMHRLIMQKYYGDISNKQIDHIDGNTLNNKKENLRVCSVSENNRNRVKTTNKTSSRYKGVCFIKTNSKWLATITYNKKDIYLGSYESEVDAAIKYNEAALRLFGEFAKINTIE